MVIKMIIWFIQVGKVSRSFMHSNIEPIYSIADKKINIYSYKYIHHEREYYKLKARQHLTTLCMYLFYFKFIMH